MHRRSRRPLTPRLVLASSAALLLALTACGSRVDADTMARMNGQGVLVGTDGQPIAAGDGAVPGAVGGAPGSGAAGPGTGGEGTTTGGATGGGPGAGPASGGEAPVGEGATAADGGVRAGSCAGFRNSTGITDSEITIANIADISGPVPGLFQSAQDATKAFVAYYNATTPDGICGRSLALSALDTRSDSAGDQQAYTRACSEAFAAVGSVSSQDQGGAAAAQGCGLPDLRAFTVTPQRSACETCFSAYSIKPNLLAESFYSYWTDREPQASQKVAVYYVDVPAAKVNAESFAAGWDAQGGETVRVQGIATSEFNYAPYAQQMKDDGAGLVMYFGPFQFTIRLQEAMAQQGVDAIFLTDPTVYDSRYVQQGGEAVDGTFVYSVIQRFDDARIPEMVLYRQWLERTAPGSVPNYYGLFAWSAARLFVQKATELGGKLTRPALVQALRGVREWDSNGIHAPMQVGAKTTPGCVKMLQLDGSTWKQVSPRDFLCGRVFDTGVGG
ncbi:ABC transporter substrate-binding protein [Nocardioides sp.]|uniref:ABC transporter substrate-binding protein n=1 Tax=Nocardioides sp. TaxID=35761 RepID=UPI00262F4C07|nr:ABC transporter substrate-binding protein [Nocardioides sp.]